MGIKNRRKRSPGPRARNTAQLNLSGHFRGMTVEDNVFIVPDGIDGIMLDGSGFNLRRNTFIKKDGK